MAQEFFGRIPVKYTGLYTDDHIIDLQEFGVSLQGLGKFTNSIFNFYLSGELSDPRRYRVRLFTAPPEPQCIIFDIVAILAGSSLPLYVPYLYDMAISYVVPMMQAVIFNRLGKTTGVDKAIEAMADMAKAHQEYSSNVHDGHLQNADWLRKKVDLLTERNKAPLRQLVQPVGKTCKQVTLGSPDGSFSTLLSEAEASVLTAKESLTVDDSQTYRGVFEAVDTTNGNCKFRDLETDSVFSGRITDPILLTPKNPYTHSLDTKETVKIEAKAVRQDGTITRLFISNSKVD